MPEELIKRIPDDVMVPKFVDGDVYMHTDANEDRAVTKVAINENYYDIQKLYLGLELAGNAKQLDGATLSRSTTETLQLDDNKISSSKQVADFVVTQLTPINNDITAMKNVDFTQSADIANLKQITSTLTTDVENIGINLGNLTTTVADLNDNLDETNDNLATLAGTIDGVNQRMQEVESNAAKTTDLLAYYTLTGAANAYTLNNGLVVLENGLTLRVKFPSLNTQPLVTINVNGTGNKKLFVMGTTGPKPGLLNGSVIWDIMYSQTDDCWFIINGLPYNDLTNVMYMAPLSAANTYYVNDSRLNGLVDGQIIWLKFPQGNTGPVTVSINGKVNNLYKVGVTPMASGDIVMDDIIPVVYISNTGLVLASYYMPSYVATQSWVNTQLTPITTNVTNLTSRMGVVEGKISTLETDNTSNKGNISALTTRMTTAESDITNLKNEKQNKSPVDNKDYLLYNGGLKEFIQQPSVKALKTVRCIASENISKNNLVNVRSITPEASISPNVVKYTTTATKFPGIFAFNYQSVPWYFQISHEAQSRFVKNFLDPANSKTYNVAGNNISNGYGYCIHKDLLYFFYCQSGNNLTTMKHNVTTDTFVSSGSIAVGSVMTTNSKAKMVSFKDKLYMVCSATTVSPYLKVFEFNETTGNSWTQVAGTPVLTATAGMIDVVVSNDILYLCTTGSGYSNSGAGLTLYSWDGTVWTDLSSGLRTLTPYVSYTQNISIGFDGSTNDVVLTGRGQDGQSNILINSMKFNIITNTWELINLGTTKNWNNQTYRYFTKDNEFYMVMPYSPTSGVNSKYSLFKRNGNNWIDVTPTFVGTQPPAKVEFGDATIVDGILWLVGCSIAAADSVFGAVYVDSVAELIYSINTAQRIGLANSDVISGQPLDVSLWTN